MAKSTVTRTKAKGSVPQKTKGQSVSATRPADYYSSEGLHCALAAPYQYIEDKDIRGRSRKDLLGLYAHLQPNSARELILAGLIVGISNATHDCLHLAATIPPHELQHREVNLRYAFKGAAAVTQLIDTYERLRGNRPANNVSVGNVNVEFGGQAIVGTVQSGSLGQEPDVTLGSDHAKAPRRK